MINVTTATTAELLAFFNTHTGGAQVKKFADRKTAERRVNALIEEMAAEDNGTVYCFNVHGYHNCPSCGIHLSNGISHHGDDVNGKPLKHDSGYQFECLGCGAGFGARVATAKKRAAPSASTGATRPEMAASMKLDRQILDVTNNVIFKNACQVWKAGLVTASQGDRLSAYLYGEAKRGNRLASMTLNGNVYTLAVKGD